MEQKQQFVSLAVSGRFTRTELCADFKISRKTGHKWLARYRQEGERTGGLGIGLMRAADRRKDRDGATAANGVRGGAITS